MKRKRTIVAAGDIGKIKVTLEFNSVGLDKPTVICLFDTWIDRAAKFAAEAMNTPQHKVKVTRA